MDDDTVPILHGCDLHALLRAWKDAGARPVHGDTCHSVEVERRGHVVGAVHGRGAWALLGVGGARGRASSAAVEVLPGARNLFAPRSTLGIIAV